jgi:hypothetical protein
MCIPAVSVARHPLSPLGYVQWRGLSSLQLLVLPLLLRLMLLLPLLWLLVTLALLGHAHAKQRTMLVCACRRARGCA